MPLDITYLKGYLDVDWRTKDKILGLLNDFFRIEVGDREFRQFVADYDQEYIDGKHDTYICYGQRGYLLTSDPKEIKKSIDNDAKRIIALSKRVYGVKKRLSLDNQLTMFDESEEMNGYEIIMKQEARYGMMEGDQQNG